MKPGSRRGISSSTRALLDERLGPEGAPFAEAVVTQLVHPPGVTGSAEREREIAEEVVRLVKAEAEDDAAACLVGDPELLAAFFQNVDLLYEHAHPRADRVSLLIMGALELAQRQQ